MIILPYANNVNIINAKIQEHKGGREQSLPLLRLRCVNQFSIYYLHSPASNVIHPVDPLHLVVCLELLRNTFHLSHLLYRGLSEGVRGVCGICGCRCRFYGLQCLYKPQKPVWVAAYLQMPSAHNLLPTSISNSADFSMGTGNARG